MEAKNLKTFIHYEKWLPIILLQIQQCLGSLCGSLGPGSTQCSLLTRARKHGSRLMCCWKWWTLPLWIKPYTSQFSEKHYRKCKRTTLKQSWGLLFNKLQTEQWSSGFTEHFDISRNFHTEQQKWTACEQQPSKLRSRNQARSNPLCQRNLVTHETEQ